MGIGPKYNAMSSATDATDSSGNDGSSTDDRDEYRKVDFNGVIDTDVLDPFIRHAKEIYSEYTVVINRYGWHIRVVEPSNVAQMDARIHVDDWAEYDSVRDGPIGVSHNSLEEMIEFVDETDGDAHVSIEDGRLTLSDGDRLFTDTVLINPDSMRQRPDLPEMDERARATFVDEQMWDMTKFIRSADGDFHISVGGNGIGFDFDTNYKGIQTDEPYVDTTVETDGRDTDGWFSKDFIYQWFKKPLKAQLTEVPYTFSFLQNSDIDTGDDCILHISREYDSESKLNLQIAPRISR